MISLPPRFRYEYCDLWGSLFLGNLPRIAEICRLWGLGVGSEELIGSAVLLRRPGARVGAGGRERGSPAMEKVNTETEGAGEWTMETQKEETPAEAKAKELESQRAMKAKLKGFLENYELIPKACTVSLFVSVWSLILIFGC